MSLNNSHIIIKRAPVSDSDAAEEKEDDLLGVYSAPGTSHFNNTHMVKSDSVTNKTTAILSLVAAEVENNA